MLAREHARELSGGSRDSRRTLTFRRARRRQLAGGHRSRDHGASEIDAWQGGGSRDSTRAGAVRAGGEPGSWRAPGGVMDQHGVDLRRGRQPDWRRSVKPAELRRASAWPDGLGVWGIRSRESATPRDSAPTYGAVRVGAFYGTDRVSADLAGCASRRVKREGHVRVDDLRWHGGPRQRWKRHLPSTRAGHSLGPQRLRHSLRVTRARLDLTTPHRSTSRRDPSKRSIRAPRLRARNARPKWARRSPQRDWLHG